MSLRTTWFSLHKLYASGFLSAVTAPARYNGNTSAAPVKRKKLRSEKRLARKFVDFRRVVVIGGAGGDGCLSFSRLPRKEWAGPDGGDGGNGGHVIFQADSAVKSLEHVRSVIRAADGTNGKTKNCFGKSATHSYIKVPVGTAFKDEKLELLADLEEPEQIFIGARGGEGGKGNRFFLTNENRAPTTYEKGGVSETRVVLAELRVMAHAGLVGFPNSGKSTLLRAISRAKPKVASYPFTTLNPHVGIVHYDDYEQVAVADIPGLIKGAHLNYGLGFSFLRHIERCVCLLYVLDLSKDAPWQQLEDLQYELEQYHAGLSSRPHAIVANKIDLPGAAENLTNLKQRVDIPVFAVSAMKRLQIDPLLVHLRELYDSHVTKPD